MMSNIFGKEPTDYAHLNVLQSNGKLDGYLKSLSNNGVNFDANYKVNTDAEPTGVGFVTNNLQSISNEVDHIMYTEYRIPELIEVATNVPEGATSYAYRVMNRSGKGSFITKRGTDAGTSHISQSLVSYSLSYGGIFAEWSIDDIRAASMAKIALQTETTEAATRGAMDHIEEVLFLGDEGQGFAGLTNHPDIPVDSPLGTTFANSTAEDIVQVIQDKISQLIVDSQQIVGRNIRKGLCVYLPVSQYNTLSTRHYGENRDRTVMQVLETNNPFTHMTGSKVEFKSLIELKGAGAGNTDRMLLGFKNKQVMEYAQPIPVRTLSAINTGYTVRVPLEYKISGLNVKRPTVNLYVDGV